jgi:hypothetical protein
MINRQSTRIELKLEDDIYEYEEMINLRHNDQQTIFSAHQCEIEINLNNQLNTLIQSETTLHNFKEIQSNQQTTVNPNDLSKFSVNKS